MFALEGTSVPSCRRISLATIDKVVTARLGQTRTAGNAQPAVFNRQIAMYLAKHTGGWSTTEIGRFYNGRDHSTVCYALKRVEALRADDPEVDGLVESWVFVESRG
jgi:chromosomal replication initiator protein